MYAEYNSVNGNLSLSMMYKTLILFCVFLIGCSIQENREQNTISSIIKLPMVESDFNTHFKSGNYIISVSDSIGQNIISKFKNSPDSIYIKMDTIDLESVEPYWTKTPITRVLRQCIERREVKIFSITESSYLQKIKRIVPKTKLKETHSFYSYTDIKNNVEIIYSSSFDTGTPPF